MKKVIFLCGGPGSGKDLILKEVLNNYNIIEYKLNQINNIINRYIKENVIVIISNAFQKQEILEADQLLKERGYQTSMIFVGVSDNISKLRLQSRQLNEEQRYLKLLESKNNLNIFYNVFDDFYYFNNSYDIESKHILENIEILKSCLNEYILNDKALKNNIVYSNPNSILENVIIKEYKKDNFKNILSNKLKKINLKKQSTSGAFNMLRSTGIGPEYAEKSVGAYRLGGLETYEDWGDMSNDSGFPGNAGSSSNKEPIQIPKTKVILKKVKKYLFKG